MAYPPWTYQPSRECLNQTTPPAQAIPRAPDNRPGPDVLLQRMITGEYGAVVVSKVDRFGRSLGMILPFWHEADAAGVRVIVINQGTDTSTPAGRLQRNTLAALAKFERELILGRTWGESPVPEPSARNSARRGRSPSPSRARSVSGALGAKVFG